jgi:hypothetical protein
MDRNSVSPSEIAKLNVEHFQKLLHTSPHGPMRTTIERLLVEEKAKLAKIDSIPRQRG